jgi:hypothetical protein
MAQLIPKRIKIPLADGGRHIIDSDKIDLWEFTIEPKKSCWNSRNYNANSYWQ